MSDETKTIMIEWNKEATNKMVVALDSLSLKPGDKIEVRFRRVIPPKRRQWVFTETNEPNRHIKEGEAFLGESGSCCIWIHEHESSGSYKPLKLEIREVADGEGT